MTKRTYDVPEVAALMGLSPWSVYAHVKDGSFPVPHISVGRRILFSSDIVDRLLAGEVA